MDLCRDLIFLYQKRAFSFHAHFSSFCYCTSSLGLRWHAHRTLAKCLIHMAHKSGNISEVSKSSSDWLDYTGFPGDACVAFFNVPSGNKDAVTPNPLTKEESHRVYNCDCKCLSGSNKKYVKYLKFTVGVGRSDIQDRYRFDTGIFCWIGVSV